jgi:hypothetical protein
MVFALEVIRHLLHSDEFNTFVLLEMLNEPAVVSESIQYNYILLNSIPFMHQKSMWSTRYVRMNCHRLSHVLDNRRKVLRYT